MKVSLYCFVLLLLSMFETSIFLKKKEVKAEIVFYSTYLKVTIKPGVLFKNVKNVITERTHRNNMNLSLQSTKQVPFFTSPEFWSMSATHAQLE